MLIFSFLFIFARAIEARRDEGSRVRWSDDDGTGLLKIERARDSSSSSARRFTN
jgi:hypothetical protein